MSSETPYVSAAAQAGVLRRAWLDVAATAAPQLPGLPALLEGRLTELENAGVLDEPSLLAVAEEASQYALEQGAGEIARALSKRLRRAIYEFLLALDAVNPAEMANAPALTPPPPVVAATEVRTPVAFTPADVPGADDPVAVLPSPPAVPLWEATAPPPVVREVYRVATRDVETLPDEPVAEALVETVDEMGAEPQAAVAEFAEAESGADDAEARTGEAMAHAAEVDEAVTATEQVDAEWAEAVAATDQADTVWAEAAVAAEAPDVEQREAAFAAPDALDAGVDADAVAVGPLGSDVEPAAADEYTPETPAEAFAPQGADEDFAPEAAADDVTPEAAGESFAPDPGSEGFAPHAATEGVASDAAGDGFAPEATAEDVAPAAAAETFPSEPVADFVSEPATDALESYPVGQLATDSGAELTADVAAQPATAASTAAPAAEEAFAPEPASDETPDAGDFAAELASADAPTAANAAEAHTSEPLADATPEPAAPELAAASEPEPPTPDTWSAPIVELPVQPAEEQAWQPAAHDASAPPEAAGTTPQLHVVPPPSGARPPRDLLRVPRQFRRLPPLPHRHTNGSTPHTPVETPAAALPPAPPQHPEPDDDTLGVPSVPWTLAQSPAPEPPAAPAAPTPEPPGHPQEEDEGVPFNPFAFATDDADLPRPPALAEEPLHPVSGADPAADHLFIQPLPGNDAPQLWTPGPVATPDYALPKPPIAEPFPIAPIEGFHLTDPGTLDLTTAPAANPFVAQPESQVPAVVPPAPPAPAPASPEPQHDLEPHPHDATDEGAWRIRQSPRAQLLAERMAQKRREETARAAFDAATFHDDDHGRGRGRKRGKQDDALPDMPTARRQLDEHLRRKRGAEAGALLQRLAQELGGRDIADLALDAGDRCRALGQSRSATNCYLAAWRADPLYETPLWRLSDVCLNDQEIELAVGYLERIAELMRSRGDDEGAIGVYRKIAMIAPERQDVRDVIRLAKTTGRLDG